MAEEQHAFAFGDVVEAVTRKMIRRHPHVFADKDGRLTPVGVKSAWERIKAEERAERRRRGGLSAENAHKSLLSGVKAGLPALSRAMQLQRKASSVGFDWNDPPRSPAQDSRGGRRDRDSTRSRRRPRTRGGKPAIYCSRWSIWRVTSAPILIWRLRSTNAKFERRFGYIERTLAARGRSLEDASLRKWTRCGTRRRARTERAEYATGELNRWDILFLQLQADLSQ